MPRLIAAIVVDTLVSTSEAGIIDAWVRKLGIIDSSLGVVISAVINLGVITAILMFFYNTKQHRKNQ
ncbi:MAG: hypothetical protein H0Z40_09775 [Desulfotomaculum sp.]|nr:hypothetical protein [Desulfotomaculum sp.]